ncbi:MAG: hypothetical protein V4649_01010 [Bacteroidota bacterium]
MKRIILLATLGCIASGIAIVSCRKNETSTPATSNYSLMYDRLKTTPTTYKVTAGQDQTIIGKDSTIIRFYPNSFKDAAGNIITSGTINIDLVEMYKPGEMIANRATTTTNDGQPLQSGGQVNITATANNGVKVFANVYSIRFKQTSPSSSPMELYYGNRNNADSVTTWVSGANGIGTTSSGTSSDTAAPITTTIVGVGPGTYTYAGVYYIFDSCTDFDWVNCDHPSTGSTTCTLSIVLPDSTTFVNYLIAGFITCPATNTVTNVWFPPPAEASGYFSSHGLTRTTKPYNALVGSEYKLYILISKDGEFYYDERTGIVAENMTINIAPGLETLYDIKARLGAL